MDDSHRGNIWCARIRQLSKDFWDTFYISSNCVFMSAGVPILIIYVSPVICWADEMPQITDCLFFCSVVIDVQISCRTPQKSPNLKHLISSGYLLRLVTMENRFKECNNKCVDLINHVKTRDIYFLKHSEVCFCNFYSKRGFHSWKVHILSITQ